MYILLLIIHVIACFVLIAVVLLQAGRGGGVSDMFGSGQPSSIFGTQTNAFLTRATEVCAVVFIITSLSLGMLSTQRGKSLVEKEMLKRSITAKLPKIPTVPTTEPEAGVVKTTRTIEVPVPSEETAKAEAAETAATVAGAVPASTEAPTAAKPAEANAT